MFHVVVMLTALRSLVLHVAGFTAFWILCIATLSEILLGRDGKDKLLTTFAADQNPRLEIVFHRVPPLTVTHYPCDVSKCLLSFEDRISVSRCRVNKNVLVYPLSTDCTDWRCRRR